ACGLKGLAMGSGSQGRMDEAELLSRRALGIQEQVLGPDALGTATTESNLAGLYVLKERFQEAEALYVRALGVLERGGADETLIGVVVKNLASLYASQARYREAEPFYLRLVALHTLGPHHPHLAMYLH